MPHKCSSIWDFEWDQAEIFSHESHGADRAVIYVSAVYLWMQELITLYHSQHRLCSFFSFVHTVKSPFLCVFVISITILLSLYVVFNAAFCIWKHECRLNFLYIVIFDWQAPQLGPFFLFLLMHFLLPGFSDPFRFSLLLKFRLETESGQFLNALTQNYPQRQNKKLLLKSFLKT